MWTYRSTLPLITLACAVLALTPACDKRERAEKRGAKSSRQQAAQELPRYQSEGRSGSDATPDSHAPGSALSPSQPELSPAVDTTPPASTTAAAQYQDADLVPLGTLDPTLLIEIPLASPDNPFRYQFFKENEAYLRYGTAKKLLAAQEDFRSRGLRLKIWSAYRPFAVQVKMWEIFPNPDWISDPYRDTGKKAHVRAVAVDVTLVDEAGNELVMPTPYLDFEHGHERMKHSFTKLPKEVLANRKLLLEVMTAHGLEPFAGEWWHYQDTEWASYPVITPADFPQVDEAILVGEMVRLAQGGR